MRNGQCRRRYSPTRSRRSGTRADSPCSTGKHCIWCRRYYLLWSAWKQLRSHILYRWRRTRSLCGGCCVLIFSVSRQRRANGRRALWRCLTWRRHFAVHNSQNFHPSQNCLLTRLPHNAALELLVPRASYFKILCARTIIPVPTVTDKECLDVFLSKPVRQRCHSRNCCVSQSLLFSFVSSSSKLTRCRAYSSSPFLNFLNLGSLHLAPKPLVTSSVFQ